MQWHIFSSQIILVKPLFLSERTQTSVDMLAIWIVFYSILSTLCLLI